MTVLFILTIENYALSLVFWSANGTFQAMGWTPLTGAMGRWALDRGAPRVIASFGSCFVAGTALTFALGGFIVQQGGVETVFMAAAVVLIPVGVAWWIGVSDPIEPSSDANRRGGSITRALGLLPPAVAIGAAYVALVVWTPAFFVEVHNKGGRTFRTTLRGHAAHRHRSNHRTGALVAILRRSGFRLKRRPGAGSHRSGAGDGQPGLGSSVRIRHR